MSLIRSTRTIRRLHNHQRALYSNLSQGHAALDRGTPRHQHPQDERAKYVGSGMSHADKSRLDASNRTSGGKRASCEGAVGNKEGVGFQDQVGGAAGDRKNPEGGQGGEEEAQSPNIIGAVKQILGVKTKLGEVKQNSGGGRGVTGTGTFRKDFHTSSGSDVGTKESPQDHNRHLPSSGQRINHPESTSERVYKREANKAKEAADTSYEPDRLSGEQDKLRYGGKQNWSKESDDGKGIGGQDEGPDKGSARGRKPEGR
ncbi:hypothetical protein BDM02DRAFT_3110888 [Thelephora ganbajun]|uniref:Uncharacterized protein n=1 Tax=Thelephora ganbajun TaxID=370292 RepID=A0ACB6ZNT5_THEGA|nr:hypothetical protein BDM02DRAFT_3110888 [Thelephora ganbajun]